MLRFLLLSLVAVGAFAQNGNVIDGLINGLQINGQIPAAAVDSVGGCAAGYYPNGTYTNGVSNCSQIQAGQIVGLAGTIAANAPVLTVNGQTGNVIVNAPGTVSVNNVAYSATPTFDLSKGDQSITLTGDVTSSTFSNIAGGQTISVQVCQDATGGHTFTWPATVTDGIVISAAQNTANPSTCATQIFKSFDGKTLYALSAGVVNQPLPNTVTANFAYVNGTHASLLTAGSNTATLGWTPAVGDALVVSVDCWGNTTTCAIAGVTDSKSNTYTSLGTVTHGATNVISAIYCAPVTSAAASMTITAAFTAQATGGDSDINVDDYSGISCTQDGTAVTGTDGGSLSATFAAGPKTTTNANDLLIAYGTASQGSAPTAGAGFTMRQNTGTAETFGFEDRAVNIVGSYSFAETTSVSTTWGMIGVALPITGALAPAPNATLSVPILNFSSQTTGTTSAAQTVTLTNAGTAVLNISNIAVTGMFNQTNNCGSVLAVNASCTISVTFSPTQAGSLTGTVSINDNAPTSPQSVALTGTATNPAGAPFAYINSVHQSNTAAGDNVATLSWTPTVGDVIIASLDCWGNTTTCAVGTLTDSNSNTYTRLATTTHGTGVLTSMYCAVVGATGTGMTVTASFTAQAAGGDSDLTVAEYSGITSCTPDGTATGTDGGTDSATYSAGPITTTQANDLLVGYGTSSQGTGPTAGAGFTMRQNAGTSETYGYEDRVTSATGAYSFTETTSVSTTWAMIGAALPISGSVTGTPNASLSLNSLTFASQTDGTSSAAQTITLTNAGTATLSISSIAKSGQFTKTTTCPATLAINASCTISVVFAPTGVGTLTGTITITDSASNSPQKVALSGTGVASGGGGSTNTPDAGAIQLSAISGCGSAGTGGNDTSCIQNAINQSGSQSKQVEIPAGTYQVDPLTLVTNTNIFLDSGTTIEASSGGYANSGAILASASGVSNVRIIGASAANSIFKMRKASYDDGSEYRHCMQMASVSTATINGISCNDSGGDGMYINGSSNNITIENSIFNNNSRNGMSVISVNGLLVDNTTFSNTVGNQTHGSNTGSAPDGPWDGIDFEPNGGSDQLKNITIQNSFMTGNGRPCPSGEDCNGEGHGGNGIMWQDNNLTSGTVSTTFNNLQTSGNLSSGILLQNNAGPVIGGKVLIENSTSTNDGQWGICLYFWDYRSGGVTFTATNNTIINPQRSYNGNNVDNAALGATAGGGDSNAFGNVTITGTNITYSGGYAFDISPYQSGGDRAITVGSFGTLTGLTGSTLGYYNGNPVNSINVP